MKHLLSISLLIIYLSGAFQIFWVLADEYWDKNYGQGYYHFIDQEITQCHPSDYVDDLLNKREDERSDAKIITTQKLQVVEIVTHENLNLEAISILIDQTNTCIADHYRFDFHPLIFHPPKG